MWRGSATNAGKPFQEASRLKTNNGCGAEMDSIDGFSFITSRCGMNRGRSFAGMRPAPTSKIESKDRKSTRLNSSHLVISYAVFCLKKKKKRENMRLSHKLQNIHWKSLDSVRS